MDGEVQPKFGLMVPLILMNITAIALFFFATPTREATGKNHSVHIEPSNSENVAIARAGIAEKVMAGDADNSTSYNGENVIVMIAPDNAKVGEGLDSQKKISITAVKDPRLPLAQVQTLPPIHSVAETQNVPGKVGIKIVDCISKGPKKIVVEKNSGRLAEPPLAIALKNFLGETSSSVRIFFEGLKSGYTKKRIREIIGSNNSMKNITTGRVSSIVQEPVYQGPNVNPPAVEKISEPSTVIFPPQVCRETAGSSNWGSWETESSSNQEINSSEIVMDILSRTQTRTNELMYVFSKKVIPAIERMNERVADAIRLEKNLDSYTSTLISAINSVVCPDCDQQTTVKQKKSKPGSNPVRKLKHTKAFFTNFSLMRDSRIHDYVRSFSKGERSSPNKSPTYKTLAGRCWHKSHRRLMSAKNKMRGRRSDEVMTPVGSEVQMARSNQAHLGQNDEALMDVSEVVVNCETKGNLEKDSANNTKDEFLGNTRDGWCTDTDVPTLTESPQQRIIGVEEVLALKSKLDQSSEQGVKSDLDVQPFLSLVSSNDTMSSGMVCRSCVIKPSGLINNIHNRIENECNNEAFDSQLTESIGTSLPNSELPDALTAHSRKLLEPVASDASVLRDSDIQDYDSCLAQKGTSSVAATLPGQREAKLTGSPETCVTDAKEISQQQSNQSISFSAELRSTVELVHVLQQLDLQQKKIAMESVCLLVLRILEAWAESQQSISSLGLSRISLSSEYSSSTEETSSQINRPLTAVCRRRVHPVQDQNPAINDIPSNSEVRRPSLNETSIDQCSAEVSRGLLQNIVAAAEILIAERSLMEAKTNFLRNIPLSEDAVKGCIGPIDTDNQTGFGDNKEIIIVDKEAAASLASKSRESVKVSKESSAATFYTSQPELSDETFYECVSTMSAGTYSGSLELEVEDSSKLFLEKIQEEGRVQHTERDEAKQNVTDEPETACKSFSVQSWLSESEELRTAKDPLNLEDFSASDNSSYDVAIGTDDEASPCSSIDFSKDESKAENRQKKKKWAAKFFKKFLKKKHKLSSSASITLLKNDSRSQSDLALKPIDRVNETTN